MISLFQAIKDDRIAHFKSGAKIQANILGLVLSESSKQDKEPDRDIVLKTIKKLIESNELSLREAFDSKLAIEQDVLKAYLPRQKTDIEIRLKVNELKDSGISSVGTINKWFRDNWNNCYDGKTLNQIIKEVL